MKHDLNEARRAGNKRWVVRLTLHPGASTAAVIARSYNSLEDGFILGYDFGPLLIPGTIDNYQLLFSGFVIPRVGGASEINSTNTITSVIVTPTASLAASLLNGPSIGLHTNPTALGQPIALAYDNAANVSTSNAAVPLSSTGDSAPGVPNDLFSVTNEAAVSLGILGTPIVIKPAGSLANFPAGVDVDQSRAPVI